MTGTSLQRKRSEHGGSLIMLVSIIGLGFIVTVAAFLVSASNGQNTARLATAKVDIATREDALVRVILQQTATGLLPGTDGVTGTPQPWTNIMTNAVTQLKATTYVDPAELAALPGLAGVIPDNMGDTAGAALGIFQGYNSTEAPFGGTSGVANVVQAPTPSVLPPLMGWSRNALLSSTNAVTIPQEFFLGSQYTSTSTPVTTNIYSKRWGAVTYPNIRFGYKQPGNVFIARRVWWRIPVVYQTAQQTVEYQAGIVGGPAGVNRYPSAPANYVLSVYEIPSQLPISGNANLQIGLNNDGTAWGSGIQFTGSIYGGQVQLADATSTGRTYNGVSSRQQVNVQNPATVGGVAYSNNTFDQLGTREQMALAQTIIGAAPVSVAGNDGKVLMVPVMPGNQFYMSATTPTHWDLYARPYYRCRIRVIISGTNSTIIYSPSQTPTINTTTAGAITLQTIVLSDTSSFPDQILGFPDSAATTNTTITYAPGAVLPSYMSYTSTAAGDRNILVIDVVNMVAALGSTLPPQLYSIYIGSNPTAEPAIPPSPLPPPYAEPGIAITDTRDLSTFTKGLSIVTNQTLYLLDSFNQVNLVGTTNPPPTSLYAPQLRYGMSGAITNVTLTGQISVDPTSSSTPPVNPLGLVNASGTPIPPASVSAILSEITDPNQVPPIARMSLMFTIEKERTN
jgi:hypothetical protein